MNLAALLFSLWTRQTRELVSVFSSLYGRYVAADCAFISPFIAEIQPSSNQPRGLRSPLNVSMSKRPHVMLESGPTRSLIAKLPQ